jgi:hypothetical protein
MRPLFSNSISIASQSFFETFHGFNKFIHLRIDIIVYQITRRHWRSARSLMPHAPPQR